MIRFDNVSRVFPGGNEGLRNVSFSVEPSEFVFLTGHSGAGKSTLLRLIALLELASRGQVLVDGRNRREWRPAIFPPIGARWG